MHNLTKTNFFIIFDETMKEAHKRTFNRIVFCQTIQKVFSCSLFCKFVSTIPEINRDPWS